MKNKIERKPVHNKIGIVYENIQDKHTRKHNEKVNTYTYVWMHHRQWQMQTERMPCTGDLVSLSCFVMTFWCGEQLLVESWDWNSV